MFDTQKGFPQFIKYPKILLCPLTIPVLLWMNVKIEVRDILIQANDKWFRANDLCMNNDKNVNLMFATCNLLNVQVFGCTYTLILHENGTYM